MSKDNSYGHPLSSPPPPPPSPFNAKRDLSRTPLIKHAKTKVRVFTFKSLWPSKHSSKTHRNTWINETQLQETKLCWPKVVLQQ